MDEFLASPSVELLAQLTKEQLWRVVEHHDIELEVVKARAKKHEVKDALQVELIAKGILHGKMAFPKPVELSAPYGLASGSSNVSGLTFKQQK